MTYNQIIRKPGSVLADHLSSLDVAAEIERITDTLWRETIRQCRDEHISLQQAGFTVLYRRRYKMRALTSLVSPFPLVNQR